MNPELQPPESDRCSVVSQDVTTSIWSGGRSSHLQNLRSQSSSVFDEDFHEEQFSALFSGPHDTGGQFDGPFSVAELVGSLSRCAESAVEGDGLPCSFFKVALPWWRSALLNLFNLCLSWNDVPTMWKHSVIVPVFKTGDHSVPGNYRPISLASCCFKVLEHMALHLAAVAPMPGRFPMECRRDGWLSEDVLHMRSATHTFVAFVDIFEAFDTSWVEATLVELFSMRLQGRMWALIAHFVHGTFWQVRIGSDLSETWQDSGIAQGRVLSPLLFNILVDGLARAVHDACPGVSLMASWDSRLCADDLVVVADSAAHLQTGLDAVSAWGFRYRFTFGVGPSKSAAMIFGPRRNPPVCNVTLGGVALSVVSKYKYLGVVLSPTLSWAAHVKHVVDRGNRVFAQCVSWCRAERLPLHTASSIFLVYVLPSIAWGSEFLTASPTALKSLDRALRKWVRFLLGLAHWFAQCWCLG